MTRVDIDIPRSLIWLTLGDEQWALSRDDCALLIHDLQTAQARMDYAKEREEAAKAVGV